MGTFIIGAIIMGTVFMLYCCIRVGAVEERWLEEMGKEFSGPNGGENE